MDAMDLRRSVFGDVRYGPKPLFGGGDPGRIRTCDLQLRRLLLYSPELRGPDAAHVRLCGAAFI